MSGELLPQEEGGRDSDENSDDAAADGEGDVTGVRLAFGDRHERGGGSEDAVHEQRCQHGAGEGGNAAGAEDALVAERRSHHLLPQQPTEARDEEDEGRRDEGVGDQRAAATRQAVLLLDACITVGDLEKRHRRLGELAISRSHQVFITIFSVLRRSFFSVFFFFLIDFTARTCVDHTKYRHRAQGLGGSGRRQGGGDGGRRCDSVLFSSWEWRSERWRSSSWRDQSEGSCASSLLRLFCGGGSCCCRSFSC